MIDWKRDGEYVVEGTNVKAEYVGKSRWGNAHFLINGVIYWQDDGVISCSGDYQGKRIIEKPKTYTVTVYVYKSDVPGVFWVSEVRESLSPLIGKHVITAPYGTGL